MTDSLPQSRFPRTGTLVLITMVLLISGGALIVWLPYFQEQRAIAEIEELGGKFRTDIIRPFWIPDAVDDKYLTFFERVTSVGFGHTQIDDAELETIQSLSHLESLSLFQTQVTDAGLIHLRGLTKLKELVLVRSQVTDAGLEHLSGLPKLECLWLNDTKISDAGIEHLRGLPNLKWIVPDIDHVTQADYLELQKAFPDREIIGAPSKELENSAFDL